MDNDCYCGNVTDNVTGFEMNALLIIWIMYNTLVRTLVCGVMFNNVFKEVVASFRVYLCYRLIRCWLSS